MKYRHNGRLNRQWHRLYRLYMRNWKTWQPPHAWWVAWARSEHRRYATGVFDRWIMGPAGEPIPCHNLMLWGTWFESVRNRKIEDTVLPDGRLVSTVFLGLDHSFGDGPPLLYETMVFKNAKYESDDDSFQQRYTSKHDALVGHARIVAVLDGGFA